VAYKHIGIKLFNDTTFGAIFSRAGLTGSKDHKTAARGVLERFVHQAPKSVSVVFVDDDWRFLKSRPDLFGSLLIRKLIDLKLTREPQFFEHDKFADEVDTWRPELQSEQE
jgi:hypothetical protein